LSNRHSACAIIENSEYLILCNWVFLEFSLLPFVFLVAIRRERHVPAALHENPPLKHNSRKQNAVRVGAGSSFGGQVVSCDRSVPVDDRCLSLEENHCEFVENQFISLKPIEMLNYHHGAGTLPERFNQVVEARPREDSSTDTSVVEVLSDNQAEAFGNPVDFGTLAIE
jgi:hypothetical protein